VVVIYLAGVQAKAWFNKLVTTGSPCHDWVTMHACATCTALHAEQCCEMAAKMSLQLQAPCMWQSPAASLTVDHVWWAASAPHTFDSLAKNR